jgi:hypothetical protein
LRNDGEVELADLLVALADKLWKGKRSGELEGRIIELIAASSGSQVWEVFTVIDGLFESIATKGDERLARSDVSKAG